MAATPQPTWTAPPPERVGAGRVIALVLGIVLLLLPGLGLVAGGGVLLWADQSERADDGFLYSAQDTFSTSGYAMVSERIELSAGADWVPLSAALGTARVSLTGADDAFVGIGPADDVQAYLGDVERTVIDDLGVDSSPADLRVLPGGAPDGPPTEQDFWTAQASGPGLQQLSWRPADGDWMLAVMNEDGSAGVSVIARIGATAPGLTGLAWGLIGGGLFLALVGVLAIVLALHRPRTVAPRPPYAGVPGSTPPPWTPPAPVDRTTAADARPEASSDQRPPAGT